MIAVHSQNKNLKDYIFCRYCKKIILEKNEFRHYNKSNKCSKIRLLLTHGENVEHLIKKRHYINCVYCDNLIGKYDMKHHLIFNKKCLKSRNEFIIENNVNKN